MALGNLVINHNIAGGGVAFATSVDSYFDAIENYINSSGGAKELINNSVQLTGDQTVAGQKTFSSQISCAAGADMNRQEIKNLVIHKVNSQAEEDALTKTEGMIWFRTDL